MRTVAFLFVVFQLLVLGPLYLIYGQVDPCRALAAEQASRAAGQSDLGDLLMPRTEMDFRRDTAVLSYGQCLGKLVESWTTRVTG